MASTALRTASSVSSTWRNCGSEKSMLGSPGNAGCASAAGMAAMRMAKTVEATRRRTRFMNAKSPGWPGQVAGYRCTCSVIADRLPGCTACRPVARRGQVRRLPDDDSRILVALAGIDRVVQRLAGKPAFQVVAEQVGDAMLPAVDEAGH